MPRSHRFAAVVSLFVLATLAPSLTSDAFARIGKRRVGSPKPTPPVQNDCFTFTFVRPGLKASYLTTSPSGNVTFTVTYISDTATQTNTTQHVVTPQATSDVETRIDVETAGILRGIKHMTIKTTTAVPVLGNVVVQGDLDFVPSLIAGPAAGWCTGNTWSVPPSTETLVTTSPLAGPSTVITTTAASTGEVLAADESITVTGGTFRCVKYRGVIVANNNPQPAITWVSRDNNIVVKQDTLDAGGSVTSTTVLTSLQ